VVLGSCQKAVAVIVSNDLTKRPHLARAVLRSEASGALHSGSRFILWHFVAVPQRFTA